MNASSALMVALIVAGQNPGLGDKGAGQAAGAGGLAPRLPQAVIERVNQAASELKRGRAIEAHKVLHPILEQANAADLKSLDDLMKDLKVEVGFVGAMVECRTRAALAGRHKELKPAGPIEAPAAAKAMAEMAAAMLAPIDRDLQVALRPNLSHAAMDEMLHQLLDYQDQLEAAQNVQLALVELMRTVKPDVKRKLPLEMAKNSAKQVQAQFKERSGQIIEKAVELCLVRLPDAMTALGAERAPFMDRIRAATRVEESLALLDKNWPKYRARKVNEAKKAEPEWRPMIAEFPKQAGPLRLKAYLLEQGKEWWLRGRYGQGALQAGLAKASFSGAGQFEQLLYAPLRMPDPIVRPENPLEKPKPTPIARRHSELWKAVRPLALAEDDPAARVVLTRRKWKLEIVGPENADLKRVAAKLDDSDPSVYFVGFLEYQMALLYFQRLLEVCTLGERQGLEESIASDDRLIVHSYLSRKYEKFTQGSTLQMQPEKSADPRAKDAYERRGLSWVMALAKVELGAMQAMRRANEWKARFEPLAGQTEFNFASGFDIYWDQIPNAGRHAVFELAPPNEFDRFAFAEVMLDGIRAEYYAISSAVRALEQRRRILAPAETLELLGSPEERTARCAVLQEMIGAYLRFFSHQLSGVQRQELNDWSRRLDLAIGEALVDRATAMRDSIGRGYFPPGYGPRGWTIPSRDPGAGGAGAPPKGIPGGAKAPPASTPKSPPPTPPAEPKVEKRPAKKQDQSNPRKFP
jgi:hypothetical protein